MKQSSRAIITGILVLARRKLNAPQVIRLAEPFGLSPTNVKSQLTRMVADGALSREGPTRLATYRPSPDQMMVINGIQDRLAKATDERWDQSWLLLLLQLPQIRKQRERLRSALWFDGFRPVSPDGFVRPAWPTAWAKDRAVRYSIEVPGICIRGCFLKPDRNYASLYDLDGLDSGARRLAAWIGRRTAYAESPHAAFVERMNVGGRVAQLIGHDPRLPKSLWGQRRGIFKMIDAFRHFEDRVATKAEIFIHRVLMDSTNTRKEFSENDYEK
jgi:DNA-binding transcriptional regulator PaaX